MRLAPCLFQRLSDLGTAHVFGIPGDHVLPLYEALADSPIRSILTTHEPSAGFAADAYARLKGIGVAMGTYGAGVLNMVNPIAQASFSHREDDGGVFQIAGFRSLPLASPMHVFPLTSP